MKKFENFNSFLVLLVKFIQRYIKIQTLSQLMENSTANNNQPDPPIPKSSSISSIVVPVAEDTLKPSDSGATPTSQSSEVRREHEMNLVESKPRIHKH